MCSRRLQRSLAESLRQSARRLELQSDELCSLYARLDIRLSGLQSEDQAARSEASGALLKF